MFFNFITFPTFRFSHLSITKLFVDYEKILQERELVFLSEQYLLYSTNPSLIIPINITNDKLEIIEAGLFVDIFGKY